MLFFGHTFNARTRFFSVLELEHGIAGEGKQGEIELEHAYFEFDLNAEHRGVINENHEPPVFYGVERNPVEKTSFPQPGGPAAPLAGAALVAAVTPLRFFSIQQY